ncbi:hypothetical protein [Virgisporangium ochraceum]|uniref:Uncharacterized protein n=1 Tax=Virgisporangium ochraceum TaxID=65505 RepID=A0A8J3ZX91_9ACTN|nr:hypothetical protein [Virgisporangium ochraceum]GIJ71744.1 hypothetical protein Voc01_066610 [Virgisporangium ochraceum]
MEPDLRIPQSFLDSPRWWSLVTVPSGEAMVVLGMTMRRLAVPAPVDAPATTDVVAARLTELEADRRRLGRPFDVAFLRRALAAGGKVRTSDPGLAVDADLHSAQVLRGSREPPRRAGCGVAPSSGEEECGVAPSPVAGATPECADR